MKKVLLTGFGPFGKTPVNPADSVAKALDGETIAGAQVVAFQPPNTFFKAIEAVAAQIQEHNPTIVVMMGEYGGRSGITVERIAQNLNDSARYELADNEGKVLQDVFTIPDGPAAYYSTLPIRVQVKAMRAAGIPSDISDAPGTNVCNHLMYGMLHYISTNQLPIRAGWIHLPHLPEVAALEENLGAPSMSVETSSKGVRICIQAALENSEDSDEPILSSWQL